MVRSLKTYLNKRWNKSFSSIQLPCCKIKLRSACFMIPSTHLCLLKIFPLKAFGCRKSRGQSWELKIVILWLDYKNTCG
ncbi:unnamed protein product [Lathyrus oleraceus]